MVNPKDASLSPNDEEGTGPGLPPAKMMAPRPTHYTLFGQRLAETDLKKPEEGMAEDELEYRTEAHLLCP